MTGESHEQGCSFVSDGYRGRSSGAAPLVAKQPAHKPYTLLWNQNSNFGYGINSQNYTSGLYTSFNDAAADDFVVPKGTTWKIKEVDVTGVYFNGSGPASSENVIFYANAKGKPGSAVSTLNNLSCIDTAGSFACKLGKKGPKLKGGTKGKRYWVSVVANCSSPADAASGAGLRTPLFMARVQCGNRGGGHWTRLPADLAFTLLGRP